MLIFLMAVLLFCLAGVVYESKQTDILLGRNRKVLSLYTNSALKRKAEPVCEISEDILVLIDQMLEVMFSTKGSGLAAGQIGRPEAVFVVNAPRYRKRDESPTYSNAHWTTPLVAVNPEIVERSSDTYVSEESCLSFPGVITKVRRPREITMRYLDQNGSEQTVTARDSLSRVIQHEMDHLKGITLFDHMNFAERALQCKSPGRFALRLWRKITSVVYRYGGTHDKS